MVCFKKAKEWYEGLVNLYCSLLIKWYVKQEKKYKKQWFALVHKIPSRMYLVNRLRRVFLDALTDIYYRSKFEYGFWKEKRDTLKEWKELNE